MDELSQQAQSPRDASELLDALGAVAPQPLHSFSGGYFLRAALEPVGDGFGRKLLNLAQIIASSWSIKGVLLRLIAWDLRILMQINAELGRADQHESLFSGMEAYHE